MVACGPPVPRPGEVALVAPPAPPAPSSSAVARPAPTAVDEPIADEPSPAEQATRQKIVASEDDPLKGRFFLADALRGLPGKGALEATIATSKGELSCTLYADKAPVTVANFVGLARGIRPFKDRGAWTTRPLYDGTTFHRVIRGFMIQGGDPQGNGTGEPGYVLPDEIWDGARHDRAGLLCMANRGHDTNGAQFFVTDAGAAHLDGNYTIFGECSPVAVVHAIANAPTNRERPLDEITIDRVTIRRAR